MERKMPDGIERLTTPSETQRVVHAAETEDAEETVRSLKKRKSGRNIGSKQTRIFIPGWGDGWTFLTTPEETERHGRGVLASSREDSYRPRKRKSIFPHVHELRNTNKKKKKGETELNRRGYSTDAVLLCLWCRLPSLLRKLWANMSVSEVYTHLRRGIPSVAETDGSRIACRRGVSLLWALKPAHSFCPPKRTRNSSVLRLPTLGVTFARCYIQ